MEKPVDCGSSGDRPLIGTEWPAPTARALDQSKNALGRSICVAAWLRVEIDAEETAIRAVIVVHARLPPTASQPDLQLSAASPGLPFQWVQ
jgi:hypothetical protein